PSPAYSQPPQSLPYCLIAYHSLRQAGLRAHLGSQLQCPKRGLLAEVAGAAVQYGSQCFSLVCIEYPLGLLRLGAWTRGSQALYTLVVEGVDSVAYRLYGTTKVRSEE